MRVRYTSTVFLFYSTNLAKIKAYQELPTSAKSLQKVLFLNTPYVILNTKKISEQLFWKDWFLSSTSKIAWTTSLEKQTSTCLHSNVNSFTQIKLQLPEYWDGICPSSEVVAVPAHEISSKSQEVPLNGFFWVHTIGSLTRWGSHIKFI